MLDIFLHKIIMILNKGIGKNISIIISIILISTGLIQIQKKQLSQLNELQKKDNYLEQEKYLEARAKLHKKMPVFGFDNLAADWNFLQFIQYFGDTEAREVTGYPVVTEYFETVVKRDPNFIKSHLIMSSANSLFAAKPEKTVELLNKASETINPTAPNHSFFLWSYKATDEILFLGDLKAAKNSYETAAKWARQRKDDLGYEMAERFEKSAAFLATNPDPTQAQIGAWMSILSTAKDKKTANYIIARLEDLGVEFSISNDGQLIVKPPEDV